MLLLNRKSRKSIGILSAGAAALLITGLGVANSRADTLVWNPSQSTTGGSNGAGTWNSSGTYWYDSTTSSGPVAWSSGSAATFGTGTGGSGTYTVTVGSSGYSTSTLSTTSSGNTYVLTGGAIDTGTAALLANGDLTLQNITVTVGNTGNTNSSPTGISQASGASLIVGNGASLKTSYIAAGNELVGNTTGNATGTIDVNSGGYLGGADTNGRIQIDYSPYASGSAFNVNGGTVNMSGSASIAWLSDSPSPSGTNPTGTFTVGANNTGGTVSVSGFNTAGIGSGSGSQTGTLNVDSGTVTTNYVNSNSKGAITILNVNGGTITAKNTASITSADGATTTVNLNGGTLSVHAITESGTTTAPTGNTVVNFNGGTLQELNASIGLVANAGGSTTLYTPTSLNVMAGGAVIDTNGYSPVIYNPLLNGTGGSTDGGLTVENSNPTNGGVGLDPTTGGLTKGGLLTITGANTYTGATVVQSGAGLQLEDHTAATPNGGVTGVATIADSSMLQIDSGAALVLNPDGAGTQISVKGLNLQGGIISLAFDGATVQNLLVGSAAAVSGTNTIILSDLASATPVPDGTYTLIADAAGGLNGTFEFANGLTTDTLTFGTNTYTGTLNDSATALTLTVSAVPEPTAVALLAVGAMGLLLLRRRKPAA